MLISACEDLYKSQDQNFVVSHGDIHTGNIITLLQMDQYTGLKSTSVKNFGLIDWEDICLDTPYGDLTDFSLHHLRKARKTFPKYNYPFEKIEYSYFQKLKNHRNHRPNDDALKINSALWNLYEMFDPVRKENIEEKAIIHHNALQEDLKKIKGHPKEVSAIKKALKSMLKDKEYLKSQN